MMARVNDGEVHMEGWLADPQGSSTPLNVLVFMGGSMVATAQTKGERPDVTSAIHLGLGAKENTLFHWTSIAEPAIYLLLSAWTKKISIFSYSPNNVLEPYGVRGANSEKPYTGHDHADR